MKWSFKRITSSGSFIPEIDGLRFIAIASVILFHISGFLIEKDHSIYTENIDYSFFTRLLSHGHLGVPLFFIISGFILALPFAKFHIGKENPVKLKKYFLRRLTRLEPPYILVMTLLLFGSIYVAKSISWNNGIISYLSSLIYSHGFIYEKGVQPLLNAPAWSLEIEVQFYILAPLIAYLFAITSSGLRRLSVMVIALLFLVFNHFNPLPFISIINYMHYFLMGFLLADLMISKETIFTKTKFDFLFGLVFFIIIWIYET
ncbi:MAG TPA: acyltransferase, partial [Ferruginibacter sp.]|nr:acyltransferase [Ferruginibacter sp.]